MKNNFYAFLCFASLFFQASCVTTSVARSVLSKNHTTTKKGTTLIDTRSLPPLGKGYRTYSWFGNAMGRQYAHHKVIATLENAFAELHETTGQTFDIAEIGKRKGGTLSGHATHNTGMSVDIMTPMKKNGKPDRLTTGPLTLFGYCWHIDDSTHHLQGIKWDTKKDMFNPCPTIPWKSKKEVDFDTMTIMIKTLKKHAKNNGGSIKFVIVDSSFKKKLKDVGVTLTDRAWIEHDDHIHVEFSF